MRVPFSPCLFGLNSKEFKPAPPRYCHLKVHNKNVLLTPVDNLMQRLRLLPKFVVLTIIFVTPVSLAIFFAAKRTG